MLGYLRAVMLACVGLGIGLSGCVYYLNPQCNDQIRNGDETGLDCGGPKCGKCDVGESCRADTDCDESNCRGGVCTPFPCDNGIRDVMETDVDCGGPTCRKCAGERHCELASDCFSGTCVAATRTCSSLTMVSFADPVQYAAGFKTYIVIAGDINGDKDLDLIAANEEGSSITVFLNDGHGRFAAIPTEFTTGEYPTGVVLVDVNHDNIPDVVTSDYHGNSVSVLLNPGNGMLAPLARFPTVAGAATQSLASGDLNKDGNVDVIATNPQTASVSVLLGRPGTMAVDRFAPQVAVPTGIVGGSQPYSVVIGDFDGDTRDDMAIGDIVNGPIIVMLGNGDGTFQPSVLYGTGGEGPAQLLLFDINNDGKLDLVSANRGSDDVSVLLGRGDGTFRKAIVSSTLPGRGPYNVAEADFNLDGVPDLVIANYKSGTATILLGIGNGHFEPAIDTGPTATNSYGVAAGDFDGDGKPDFATANSINNNMTVKLSTSR